MKKDKNELYKCPKCKKYYELSEEAYDYIKNRFFGQALLYATFINECSCGAKCVKGIHSAKIEKALGKIIARKAHTEPHIKGIYNMFCFNYDERIHNQLKVFKANMLV